MSAGAKAAAGPPPREEINVSRVLQHCQLVLGSAGDMPPQKARAALHRIGLLARAADKTLTQLSRSSERRRQVDALRVRLQRVEDGLRRRQHALAQTTDVAADDRRGSAGTEGGGERGGAVNSSPAGGDRLLRRRQGAAARNAQEDAAARSDLLGSSLDLANVDNDELQAQLTDEMVELARGLKEQSMLASGILKEDAETLEETDALASANLEQMGSASEMLRRELEASGACWVWIMMLAVLLVFFLMVLFIKITNTI